MQQELTKERRGWRVISPRLTKFRTSMSDIAYLGVNAPSLEWHKRWSKKVCGGTVASRGANHLSYFSGRRIAGILVWIGCMTSGESLDRCHLTYSRYLHQRHIYLLYMFQSLLG
jgi:hypothetical protein